jgi:predicted nucleic acid-binding protein
MILVVADTGPIHYLVLIEAVGLLPRLYDLVVLPKAVHAELTHPNAPAPVKSWAAKLPPWVQVKAASHIALGNLLDPGEAEAIVLAQELHADSLLLDEKEGRQEALRLGLPVSGTIGVLEKAAERKMISLSEAFARLSRTNFHIAPEVLQQALQREVSRSRAMQRGRKINP